MYIYIYMHIYGDALVRLWRSFWPSSGEALAKLWRGSGEALANHNPSMCSTSTQTLG